ncbi:MAG: oligosaccharide flippase family protein, partial [Anaerolineales bacterium]
MLLQKLRALWQSDGLFRRVVRNSSYLFSSSAIGAALGMLNGILVTRLLGVDGYGLAVGTIILFASNVNNLLAFRMYEAVVKFVGDALHAGDFPRAAALVKGIGLAEAVTSVAAYLVLAGLTPWAAAALGKDVSTAPLFLFYGLSLLGNLVFETARGVLQMTRRFDRLSQLGILQSAITTALIGAAFVSGQASLWAVLGAYLAGKLLGGVAHAALAWRELDKTLPAGWLNTPLRTVTDWRAIGGFALNTNLHATVNLFARDSIPNLLAYLRPAEIAHLEVGYFRLAQGIISLMMLP